jgi:hypothetical protein
VDAAATAAAACAGALPVHVPTTSLARVCFAAFGPLPVQLPPIPVPFMAGSVEQHLQQLKTPLKEVRCAALGVCWEQLLACFSRRSTPEPPAPQPPITPLLPLSLQAAKSISFPAIESPLWSPMALFQHCLPAGSQPAAAPTRSTGRARQRWPSGQLSPARHPPPPPLFDAPPPAAQQQLFFGGLAQLAGQGALAKSGSNMQALAGELGLIRWKSEVSANMTAFGTAAGPAAPAAAASPAPAAAAAAVAGAPRESSPINSPRYAALMAVCRGEAEQPQQQPPLQPVALARMASNLSSHYSGCAAALPGEQQHQAAPAAGLVKQKSDLAELALLAEEEYQAAAAAAAAEEQPAGAAGQQQEVWQGQTAAAGAPMTAGKRGGEGCKAEAGQPAAKRQRVGSNSPPLRHRGAAAGAAAAAPAADVQGRPLLEDAGSLPLPKPAADC